MLIAAIFAGRNFCWLLLKYSTSSPTLLPDGAWTGLLEGLLEARAS